ncbi:MAG: hypothetical protein KDC05_07870 [Bacteroidales bacterium]|nr:hypothetical protein [Bacteroidales bacterium]
MKEIKLLESQLEKLNKKDFDLEAWKQYTVVLLARIFGEYDPKIKQIEKIEYDFSSWALRDTTGKSAYMETCKKLGREVLQASIDELKTFGVPDKDIPEKKAVPVEVIIESLEDELKISQLRKLSEIVNSEIDQNEKRKKLLNLVKSLDEKFSDNFILNLFTNPSLKGKL